MTRQHNQTQVLPAIGVVHPQNCHTLVVCQRRHNLCILIVRKMMRANQTSKHHPPDPSPVRFLPQCRNQKPSG
ncbi:hypothetical protein L6R29_25805 [Myxococcota bacterium]|nr:hypothetical protein [Myxococcota bacterium]